MLFHSLEFLLLFLPITAIVFYLIGKTNQHRIATAWLVTASIFFYGWWNPSYIFLIILSMLFNYCIGLKLSSKTTKPSKRKALLIGACTANLGLLAYYKYSDFLIGTVNAIGGTDLTLQNIVLPLAISFFTFQQIAYLVDAYRYEMKDYDFLHYALFVTFFPQLIAGPIVHHKEMMPQFDRDSTYRFKHENLALGLSIFFVGLGKKLIFADKVAVYVNPIFLAAESGQSITFLEGWAGALCYTMQLYFDFSGYCDMAIGVARIFGITLPTNFNSPYKAKSIVEFWRRWHITLSRFLRDYLYIGLGGNRKGPWRQQGNLLATMLLGGLWHGAGWNFILWGAWHGILLVINHIWRQLGFRPKKENKLYNFSALALTFICVVFGWVFFRAQTFSGGLAITSGMLGLNGCLLNGDLSQIINNIGIESSWFIHSTSTSIGALKSAQALTLCAGLMVLCLIAPNSQEIFAFYQPTIESQKPEKKRFYHWRPHLISTALFSILAICMAIEVLKINKIREFLYFDF